MLYSIIVRSVKDFKPRNIRSNHLTKEDFKHQDYNLSNFLRLQGGVIARFVKKAFEKPFESAAVKTITCNHPIRYHI